MLPFYLAVALFVHAHGRPPRKREHADLLASVRGTYERLRCSPSPDPTVALEQLRASASVREIVDVALDGPGVTEPHSFVLRLEELAATAQRHRTFVIENVGCLVYFKRAYYLVSESRMKRIPLADVFARRRPCRAVIVLGGLRPPNAGSARN